MGVARVAVVFDSAQRGYRSIIIVKPLAPVIQLVSYPI